MILLVTGCSSGIGLSIVRCAAEAGHDVYAGVRRLDDADRLHALCAEHDSVTPLQLDVTVAEQRAAAVARIIEERGHIDCLVNNAGVGLGGFLEQLDEEELRHVFDVNLFAPWALVKACLPHMRRARRGLIVMISSFSGRMALPVIGAYASSKFALEGLSEALRHECRPFGVRVTVVEPGAYDTEMFGRNRRYGRRALLPDGPYAGLMKASDEQFQKTVKKKMRSPDEVARLVVSLLSNPRPRMRYAIGPGVRLRSIVLRFAPYGLVDFLVSRVLKSP